MPLRIILTLLKLLTVIRNRRNVATGMQQKNIKRAIRSRFGAHGPDGKFSTKKYTTKIAAI